MPTPQETPDSTSENSGQDSDETREAATDSTSDNAPQDDTSSDEEVGEAPGVITGEDRQPRREPQVGERYYRDFAAWDGPIPQVTRSSDETRITVTINTAAPDRHGTIIMPGGAEIGSYNENNPIVLINHDPMLAAANSVVTIRGEGTNARLQANVEDEDWDMDDEEVAKWKRKVDKGIIRAASIGFMPLEVKKATEVDEIDTDEIAGDSDFVPRVITRWQLMEWSFVSVPSNPEAVVTSRDAGGFQEQLQALRQEIQETNERVAQLVPDRSPEEAAEEAANSDAPEVTSAKAAQVRDAAPADYARVIQKLVPVIDNAIDRKLGRA